MITQVFVKYRHVLLPAKLNNSFENAIIECNIHVLQAEVRNYVQYNIMSVPWHIYALHTLII